MAYVFSMPRLGLTMTEGLISHWMKAEGDTLEEGDELVEIESDKAITPLESPMAGVLLKILVPDGEIALCQAPIAIIGEVGESIPDSISVSGADGVYDVNLSDLSIAGDPKQNGAEIEQESTHTSYEKPADPQNNPRIIASPAAKRVAKELNVEIANIPIPEGKLRVEKGDVVNYHESISKRAETFSAQKTTADAVSESDHAYDVNGMRKIIATRMKESLNIAAHVSLTAEADMSSAIAMKSDIEQEVMETYGVKLSLNEIILKCVATALTQHPRMNSVFTQDQIIEKGEINLGVAIALEEGLVVPVIRNCNHLSIGTISKEVKRLTQKARETGLSPDDSTGGTFTVSNLGMFGIVQFTSIINQPESAILSVGKIVKRPVVLDDDEIKIRPIMNLTINFDHRPIDGAMAATFLKTLVKLLETPYLLLR